MSKHNTVVKSISFSPSVLDNMDRCMDVYCIEPKNRSAFINYIMKEVTNKMIDTIPRSLGNSVVFDLNLILSFDESED